MITLPANLLAKHRLGHTSLKQARRRNHHQCPSGARLGILATLLIVCAEALAVELSDITWRPDDTRAVVSLAIDGHPEYQFLPTDASSNSAILVLKNTRLTASTRALPARGIVTSASLATHDQDVRLRLSLQQAATPSVVPTPAGYDVVVVAATAPSAVDSAASSLAKAKAVAKAREQAKANAQNFGKNQPRDQAPAPSSAQAPSAPAAAAPAQQAPSSKAELTQLSFARVSGDRVQINLGMNRPVADPKTFRTVDPPRIAFDFVGLTNKTDKRQYPVRTAAVDSITVVETDKRLRLVLNLLDTVNYDIKRAQHGLVVTVGGSVPAPDTQQTSRAITDSRGTPAGFSIQGIDFRRTPQGAGRVIVKLSNAEIAVDLEEQGGEIIASFPNTYLPGELEQRLDVVDFATPVSSVDSYTDGNNVKLVITPSGQYKQSSVQAGQDLIIDVAPLTEAEQEVDEEDEFGYSGERLSLNFQKISVRAALQVLADFTGLNFVTSDSISGDLSLHLKDVPWDQALDVILQTKGLAMRQKGNVIWVAPADEVLAKEAQVLEAQQQVGEIEPLVSELIKVSFAKAEDLANILKSIKAVDSGIDQSSAFSNVSVSEVKTEENNLLSARGSVTVDVRTNSLLIQDTATKLREIRKLIAKLDIPVRQVQIETRIVQANNNFSKSIGSRLGFTQVSQQGEVAGTNVGDVYGSGSIENTNSVRSEGTTEVSDDALSVNLPAGAVRGNDPASYAFTLAKLGSGFLGLLDLEISALQAEGNGRMIANPKILTTDKRQASIEQGQERTRINTSGLGGASAGTQKAVLNLTVTPQITPDDKITLDVQITNDSFVDAAAGLINTNRITTQALLENGETIVIGGIYTQDQAHDIARVPVLGNIPFIGRLFRSDTNRDIRSELMIFLTPRIIDPDLAIN